MQPSAQHEGFDDVQAQGGSTLSAPVDQDTVARGRVASQANWVGADAVSGDTTAGVHERSLATVTWVENENGASTYSFAGGINYVIGDTGRSLQILAYRANGTFIDGFDLGDISYHNTAPWTTELCEDRTFEIRGEVAWSDLFNQDATLDTVFRGTLLESGGLAFLSSEIQGMVAVGATGRSSILMEVPAGW